VQLGQIPTARTVHSHSRRYTKGGDLTFEKLGARPLHLAVSTAVKARLQWALGSRHCDITSELSGSRHDTHFTVLSHKHTAISPDKSCRGKAEKAGVSLRNQVPSIPYRRTGPPARLIICGEGAVRRHLETS
jgi:hypothetical protein